MERTRRSIQFVMQKEREGSNGRSMVDLMRDTHALEDSILSASLRASMGRVASEDNRRGE
jgi:hypothetical protein